MRRIKVARHEIITSAAPLSKLIEASKIVVIALPSPPFYKHQDRAPQMTVLGI